MPITHRYPPKNGEAFATLTDAINRLHNWSLFYGFAYVIKSSKKDIKTIMRCIHHRKEL